MLFWRTVFCSNTLKVISVAQVDLLFHNVDTVVQTKEKRSSPCSRIGSGMLRQIAVFAVLFTNDNLNQIYKIINNSNKITLIVYPNSQEVYLYIIYDKTGVRNIETLDPTCYLCTM